jgi:hypothetical protein
MKKLLTSLLIGFSVVFLSFSLGMAADVALRWDAATGATSYAIRQSVDNGVTWSSPVDVGNVTERVVTGVPETGVVLMIVSGKKGPVETIPFWRGVFYDHTKRPPDYTTGVGIK